MREKIAFVGLLAASAALRLPFWADRLFHLDSFGLAQCSRCPGPGVAHPPGFIGYCTTTALVHCVTGNRIFSMILVPFVSTMGSIALCWLLARRVGLTGRRALLVTAAYSISINTLYFSVVGLSYAVEGFFATAVGLLALLTMQRRTWKTALALSGVWALGGAIRPTTTLFLGPLWLFACLHVRPRWRVLTVSSVAAAALIAPWVYGNHHYLDKIGPVSSFEFQAGLAGGYDPASLLEIASGPYTHSKGMGHHWPFVEIAMYVDDQLGTGLFPRRERWADPSLRHALRISAYQLLKLVFYAGISAPVLVSFLFLLPWRWGSHRDRRSTATAGGSIIRSRSFFYLLWFVPASLFFVTGHLGSFGYLQVFLAGLTVASCEGIMKGSSQAGLPRPISKFCRTLAVALPLCGGAFFMLARPLEGRSNSATLATVALFQYTGPAIRMRFNVSRADLLDERTSGRRPWWRTDLPNMTFDE